MYVNWSMLEICNNRLYCILVLYCKNKSKAFLSHFFCSGDAADCLPLEAAELVIPVWAVRLDVPFWVDASSLLTLPLILLWVIITSPLLFIVAFEEEAEGEAGALSDESSPFAAGSGGGGGAAGSPCASSRRASRRCSSSTWCASAANVSLCARSWRAVFRVCRRYSRYTTSALTAKITVWKGRYSQSQ